MINKKLILASSLLSLAFLSACSSDPKVEEKTSVGTIPSWVLSPSTDDGIAVTECVLWSGNISIDKQQATAYARVSLAQRIETKVSALDTLYRDKIEVEYGTQSGSTFSSVSKQVTQQTLVGTTPLKVDIIDIDNKQNLCVLMAIGQESTKNIFENILSASKLSLNKASKDILYQEFKSEKAQKNLDLEILKLNK